MVHHRQECAIYEYGKSLCHGYVKPVVTAEDPWAGLGLSVHEQPDGTNGGNPQTQMRLETRNEVHNGEVTVCAAALHFEHGFARLHSEGDQFQPRGLEGKHAAGILEGVSNARLDGSALRRGITEENGHP